MLSTLPCLQLERSGMTFYICSQTKSFLQKMGDFSWVKSQDKKKTPRRLDNEIRGGCNFCMMFTTLPCLIRTVFDHMQRQTAWQRKDPQGAIGQPGRMQLYVLLYCNTTARFMLRRVYILYTIHCIQYSLKNGCKLIWWKCHQILDVIWGSNQEVTFLNSAITV